MPEVDAPRGWHWGLGNSSTKYYTYWLYSDDTFELDELEQNKRSDGAIEWGYEIEQYWDEGQLHTVVANKSYYDIDGDVVNTERVTTSQFNSKEEATQKAISIAGELL